LPLLGAAHGVETVGLRYPLNAETLYPDRTRGISNVLDAPQALVKVAEGMLLCVHFRRF
jgi:thiamine pyrophosphokinase